MLKALTNQENINQYKPLPLETLQTQPLMGTLPTPLNNLEHGPTMIGTLEYRVRHVRYLHPLEYALLSLDESLE